MSEETPNICKGSTEDDKHALATIPIAMPPLIPTACTTTHDFVYLGGILTDWGLDSPVTWADVGAGSHSQEILALSLNDPFLPIHGMYLTHDNFGFSTTQSQFFSRYTAPYYSQGINLYKDLYNYYKVNTSEWSIEFLNYQGYDAENPTVPVVIHSYHENNDGTIPTLTYPTATQANMTAIASLMMNPRVGTICGGAPLGTSAMSGYSGLTAETVVFPYAPSLQTNFKWSNKSSVASDPASVNNMNYWTLCSGVPPTPPTPVQRLHFFMTPYMGGVFGNTAVVRPVMKIRARFNITWRDHEATSYVFSANTY